MKSISNNEFNDLLESHKNQSGQRLILRGYDLRNVDMQRVFLREADLQDCDLTGCNLNGSTFYDCDMDGVQMSGATAKKCDLRESKLRNANLKGVAFNGSKMRGTDIRGADVTDADFTGVDRNELIVLETRGWNMMRRNKSEPVASDNRSQLASHISRLGWSTVRLAEWLSETTGDDISLSSVRAWLADPDRSYARTCPGWPSALIEAKKPE